MSQKTSKVASPTVLYAMVLVVVAWVTHMILRSYFEPGDPIRLAVTSLLVLCFAWAIFEEVRVVRKLDEFHRQFHNLALSVSFPVALILLFALGFFRAEGFLQGADPRDLPSVLLLAYSVGLGIAWKRFR